MDPKNLTIGLLSLLLSPAFAVDGSSSAAGTAGNAPTPLAVPDTGLALSPETATLEEGKALYENGQLIAALGKFMTVLRKDPHDTEARQYLRMIIDTLRQNPAISASKLGTNEQAVASNPAVQEEIRRMLQLRSRLTMDLKAIPGLQMVVKVNVNQVIIDTPLLFDEKSGGLKEQGVPMLDRVAAWLKTFGQQPVIIHCYPEELQEASSNGALFLRRYSELFNFFVEERKLLPQRFVSADLLTASSSPATAGNDDQKKPRVIIETIGTQSSILDAMPSMAPGRALSQWLESSISPSRRQFNPEEGEWVDLDLAAMTRMGLHDWTFSITPVQGKSTAPVFRIEGKGNLLKRLSWDGHDQKTGDFVRAGNYVAKLTAANGDGTIKSQEEVLQVERTTKEAPVVVQKPKAKTKPQAKAKKPKVKPVEVAKADTISSPLVGEGRDGGANPPTPVPPPASSPTRGEEVAKTPAADDSGESVHAIWKQVIQFEPNQSEPMPTVKASLERIGKTLEVYPLQKVRITGFAMASENSAGALAVKRAETVRTILVEEYHVDARRVIVAGGKTSTAENASKVEMSITN